MVIIYRLVNYCMRNLHFLEEYFNILNFLKVLSGFGHKKESSWALSFIILRT